MAKEKSMRALLAERTRTWMSRVPEAGTQAKLSARAGMSQSSIHRVLFQDTEPELDTAFKLASAFGITVAELLAEDGVDTDQRLPFDVERYQALPETEKEKIKAFAEFVIATHETSAKTPSIVSETIHATPSEMALARRVAQRNLTTDTLSTHENQQETSTKATRRNKGARS
ncbi:helix-turn-helix transcriptional regulator [Caballeronia sp. dw_276]|uniref:helix-turn-helix domain-containing protein n=1 Tax=Caballeronia sp. dw_276 TaxID=2719795 RepID=UPI001BD40A84|nr:helix-turn-helix transcriptional regulator [Caballeronia sp. dw_276]